MPPSDHPSSRKTWSGVSSSQVRLSSSVASAALPECEARNEALMAPAETPVRTSKWNSGIRAARWRTSPTWYAARAPPPVRTRSMRGFRPLCGSPFSPCRRAGGSPADIGSSALYRMPQNQRTRASRPPPEPGWRDPPLGTRASRPHPAAAPAGTSARRTLFAFMRPAAPGLYAGRLPDRENAVTPPRSAGPKRRSLAPPGSRARSVSPVTEHPPGYRRDKPGAP